MEAREAAVVIDRIIESLRSNPAQFNINVSVTTTGAIGVGGSGGPGIVGIAHGGGTGFSATASAPTAAQVHIAQQPGFQQLSSEMSAMLETLQQLKLQTIGAPR